MQLFLYLLVDKKFLESEVPQSKVGLVSCLDSHFCILPTHQALVSPLETSSY